MNQIEKTERYTLFNEHIFDLVGFFEVEQDPIGTKFRWTEGVFKVKPQVVVKNICIQFISLFNSPFIVFVENETKNTKTELFVEAGKEYVLSIPVVDKPTISFYTQFHVPNINGDTRNLAVRVKNLFPSTLYTDNVEFVDVKDIESIKIKETDDWESRKIHFMEIEISKQKPDIEIVPFNYTARNFQFNSCIFQFNQKTYILTRNFVKLLRNVSVNKLRLYEFETMKEIDLIINSTYEDEQYEDPRAFVHNNRLYVSCAIHIYGDRSLIHQKILVFDENFKHVDSISIRYGKNGKSILENTGVEKNWTFFVQDDKLMCIYKISPHTVLHLDWDGTVICEYKTHFDVKSKWILGECRGGANPILKDGFYHSFFHSSVPWKRTRRRYVMGKYSFEPIAPYRIVNISTEPILWGNESDQMILPNDNPLVIFPCGAIIDDKNRFVVSFGLNDEKTGIITI